MQKAASPHRDLAGRPAANARDPESCRHRKYRPGRHPLQEASAPSAVVGRVRPRSGRPRTQPTTGSVPPGPRAWLTPFPRPAAHPVRLASGPSVHRDPVNSGTRFALRRIGLTYAFLPMTKAGVAAPRVFTTVSKAAKGPPRTRRRGRIEPCTRGPGTDPPSRVLEGAHGIALLIGAGLRDLAAGADLLAGGSPGEALLGAGLEADGTIDRF